MKNLIRYFLFLCVLISNVSFSQTERIKLEKTATFFPGDKEINQDDIAFYYFTVPENWNNPSGKKIKIAVAILKSNSESPASDPTVYLEGGPGSRGMGGIRSWARHPLRKNGDIVLLDVRGTGNSTPKFCPDLGEKFMEILSKNQNREEDERQKMIAAMACKQDLINRDIDLNAYNSKSIAKDLNALKTTLKYDRWNVYGVSYGTYTAQVYANDFPEDITAIILDSPIPNIADSYYNTSTSKYMNSLEKVFEECLKNPDCNKEYPDLENTYYKTIKQISENPITVKVDKETISSGIFTYNVEDFKVCIQQALYRKPLIEVIPLLITRFHQEDKSALSSLVAAFSGSLGLDYGTFYCVTCNEAFPYNSIAKFNEDALQYKKLNGGISFYQSDFQVCDKWNVGIDRSTMEMHDMSKLPTLNVPVLVYSGAFDPLTPPSYAQRTVEKFKNAYLVNAPVSGHCPGFSKIGYEIAGKFVSNPAKKPDTKKLNANKNVNFVTNIHNNKGVPNFANSVNKFNPLFFAPFLIAVIILLISVFNNGYTLIKNKNDITHNKFMKIFMVITSLLAIYSVVGLILAINNTAQINFYILAFGLPERYSYLFILPWVFVAFTLVSILYFLLKMKSMSNLSIKTTILFSLVLVGIYFQYWGFLF